MATPWSHPIIVIVRLCIVGWCIKVYILVWIWIQKYILQTFIAVKKTFLHNFLQSINKQALSQPPRGLSRSASHLVFYFIISKIAWAGWRTSLGVSWEFCLFLGCPAIATLTDFLFRLYLLDFRRSWPRIVTENWRRNCARLLHFMNTDWTRETRPSTIWKHLWPSSCRPTWSLWSLPMEGSSIYNF